ncbi:hypothetical protein BC6307_09660 [Sutcliffiella cohnii]|uniref:DUF58 domain-containing protein n=1 Tax=Sutcliffiella cohnii TaxID=33932 RepID=A0A223KQB9_9BACI|nr:DUF58 domain-containing protein [Sutcliffiella cohnii]AST91528.1 hypothetical protein BC6307_09660 [Sutcliffiella cohnii]
MIKYWKRLLARFLFQDRGIVPTKKLIVLLSIIYVTFVMVGVFIQVSIMLFVFSLLALFISLIDLAYTPKRKEIHLNRIVPDEIERGKLCTFQIQMINNSNKAIHYTLKDGLPQNFRSSSPFQGTIKPMETEIVLYDTSAQIRGNYTLNKVYVRYKSNLGLWEKQMVVDKSASIRVIPDLSDSKRYLENAQKFLLYDGEKIRKQISGAGEFSKIRSYSLGDDPRKINWRQTAKLREIMTNEYEPEHGKYITLLIDCGRMMGTELTKSNRLEKSMEAAITVATAALNNGDYVSILAFSKDVKVYVPPGKGMAHLQTILKSIYNIHVDQVESNYALMFQHLQMLQKKRSLLILFSDVRTFLYEESVLPYLVRLRKRHLFLLVGVEDLTLQKMIKRELTIEKVAMIKSVAQQQFLFKRNQIAKWEKHGLQMMEAKEERLAPVVVSHYIDLLNRGLL